MTNAISKKYEHRVHLLLISRSLETALRSDKLAHSKTVPSGLGSTSPCSRAFRMA